MYNIMFYSRVIQMTTDAQLIHAKEDQPAYDQPRRVSAYWHDVQHEIIRGLINA